MQAPSRKYFSEFFFFDNIPFHELSCFSQHPRKIFWQPNFFTIISKFFSREAGTATFHKNRGKMALYGNLFYLLRTEPHYLATLTNLVDPRLRNDMCQLIILTLFTNAFSPTQELMLLRLISTAVSYDIQSSSTFFFFRVSGRTFRYGF
jgi:hypothetical protein